MSKKTKWIVSNPERKIKVEVEARNYHSAFNAAREALPKYEWYVCEHKDKRGEAFNHPDYVEFEAFFCDHCKMWRPVGVLNTNTGNCWDCDADLEIERNEAKAEYRYLVTGESY